MHARARYNNAWAVSAFRTWHTHIGVLAVSFGASRSGYFTRRFILNEYFDVGDKTVTYPHNQKVAVLKRMPATATSHGYPYYYYLVII